MQNTQIITPCDLSRLEAECMPDGVLRAMPFAYYSDFSGNELKYLMWKHGIYVLPTTELIEWLSKNITGTAIEIGAGLGAIARGLGIPATDSKLQESDLAKFMYGMTNQPTIKYGSDIEKLDAEQAIFKYSPDTVIGAFITHKYEARMENGNQFGVKEEDILKACVKYINIGNLVTHKDKPILKIDHEEYKFPWLFTRAGHQDMNRIFVWKGNK